MNFVWWKVKKFLNIDLEKTVKIHKGKNRVNIFI